MWIKAAAPTALLMVLGSCASQTMGELVEKGTNRDNTQYGPLVRPVNEARRWGPGDWRCVYPPRENAIRSTWSDFSDIDP